MLRENNLFFKNLQIYALKIADLKNRIINKKLRKQKPSLSLEKKDKYLNNLSFFTFMQISCLAVICLIQYSENIKRKEKNLLSREVTRRVLKKCYVIWLNAEL